MAQLRAILRSLTVSVIFVPSGVGVMAHAAQINTVRALDFIGAEWMESSQHRVAPTAKNNGHINSYTIETNHGTFIIDGTEQARAFIREIVAAEELRQKSTVGMVGTAVKERVVNLVKTPLEVVNAVGDRIDTVSSVEDAILLAPRTSIDVGEKLLNGAGEMIYTGNRLIKSASGTKCTSLGNCLSEAGEDIFSGINSVVGKHNSARRLHARYGTDAETRNPILQREIDRLSYAQAYTKTGIRVFAPNTGFSEFDSYRDAVGFYDNSETVAGYKDAFKPRINQIKRLEARGIHPDLIKAFYKNENYTKKEKVALIDSLERLDPQANIGSFIEDAAQANTSYAAKSFVDNYRYLSYLQATQGIQNFKGTTKPIAITHDGHHILTLKADYLNWTPQAENVVRDVARLPKSEIHILGHASADFKRRALELGVRIVEIR